MEQVRIIDERVRRLRRLSTLLDSAAPIPGTPFRIGLDSLIGLVPGIGDSIGVLASTYIIMEAARIGASKRALARMGKNVLIDGLLGAVPLLGDLFDVGWKANNRNVALLEEQVQRGRLRERSPQEVSRLIVAVVGTGVLLAAACFGLLVGLLLSAVF